jgi:hypothetical protein
MPDHRFYLLRRARAVCLAVVLSLSQVFSLVPFVSEAAAGVPNFITYQGRLKGSDGVAVDGTYDFIFGFYDAASGGTLLATENETGVTVDDGYFAVNLDLDGDIADFANLLYLDIQVKASADAGYDAMSSRVAINSTPYSLFTRGVENLAADPVTNVFAGRTYFNTTDGSMYVYNGTTWDQLSSGMTTGSTLDDAYNAYGATPSKVNVDAAEGQTGGLEFESNISGNIIFDLQNTGDFVLQDGGATFATFADDGTFAVTGATTLAALTANGALVANGAITLGDGGDVIAINSSDWDIGATGNVSGIGSIAMDGAFTQTGVVAFSTGTGAVSLNGATTVANGNAFTANGAVTLGDGGDALVIDSTNFDVASSGAMTVAAGQGLDTNAAGALNIGNTNATSISLCNSAACDTLTFGTNADADTITIGDSLDSTSVNSANWSITTGGAANFASISSGSTSFAGNIDLANNLILNIGNAGTDFVAGGGLTLAGAFTGNGTLTLGDGGDTVTIDSSDWDISATGNATGIGSVTMDGSFSQTGIGSFSTGTGIISLNGATTVVNGSTFTANGSVVLGDGGDTIAIDSTNFDVATSGAVTVAAGVGLDTNGAGALLLGNTNATSVSLCNSAACDTLTLGTNVDADTITIGDSTNDTLSLNGSSVAIAIGGTTVSGSEITVLDGGITNNELTDTGTLTVTTVDINGGAIDGTAIGASSASTGAFTTLASTGVTAIGNNSATVAINSSDWDISATGDITGVGGVTMDGAFSQTGTGTHSTGTGAVSLNGDTTIASGRSFFSSTLDTAAAGALAVGNVNATSVSLCNSAACDTVTIGSNADADTITIGDASNDTVSLNGSSVSLVISGTTVSGSEITVLDGGIALSELTDSGTFTATTVDINGGAIDGTAIGASSASTGAFTTLSSTGATTIGNNSATVAINSSDWDISATGDITGAGGLTMDGSFSQTGTGSFSTATGAVSLNGDTTVATGKSLFVNTIDRASAGALAIGNATATSVSVCNSAACDTYTLGTNTDADTITIGEANDSVSLTSANWSITSAGAASFASMTLGSTTFSGPIDMGNNLILNIGNAGTDFTSGGGLTLAGAFTANGSVALGDGAGDNITFNGVVNSNIVADNNTRNIGSSSTRFATGYFDTVDATTISGTIAGGSTTSSAWTINSDNVTTTTEASSLAFERGSPVINAVLQWNASGDAGRVSGFDDNFVFNFPIAIYSQVSGINTTFTSGNVYSFAQPAAHAITQTGALTGISLDMSSNITTPNSSSGNQTGVSVTLADGGASATTTGVFIGGGLDRGIDFSSSTLSAGGAHIYNDTGLTMDLANGSDTTFTLQNSGAGNANIAMDGDLALNGGDLASSSGTFNLLDASGSTTIEMGGVTTDLGNTISIATNSTTADTITIGNTNTASALTLNSGAWNISSAGVLTMTATSAQTTAFVVTDTDYTNALSVGDNNITGTTYSLIGTTSAIDFTNFDVASTGAVTVAAGQGMDTNGAGALALGNTNATSVSICNSANCDTLSLATNTDADTVTIGDSNDSVAVTSANWNIQSTGNALFGTNTTTSTTTPLNVSFGGTYGTNTPGSQANLKWDMYNSSGSNRYGIGMSAGLMEFQAGSNNDGNFAWWTGSATERMRLTTAGNLGIGDSTPASMLTVGSGDLFQVNSSGAIVASTGYTQTSGNFAMSGTGTFGTGTGAVSLNGDTAVASGKSLFTSTVDTAAAGALAVGNVNATSVTLCNSAACDTVTIGSNADADTITIGDSTNDTVSVNGSSVSLVINGTTVAGSEITVLDGGITNNELTDTGTLTATTVDINGGAIDGTAIGASSASTGAFTTLVSNGITTIGDGSATVAIDSSDWDIATNGNMTGIGNIDTDGNFTQTGNRTFSTGIGNISLNGDTTVAGLLYSGSIDTAAAGTFAVAGSNATTAAFCNSANCDTILIGTTTDADTITIGDSNDTMSLNGGLSSISFTNFHVLAPGDVSFGGTLTIGDGSPDTVTSNAAAWTFPSDTTVALTGGVNGINFDSNTLSIDATNNRIGIGTAAPGSALEVANGTVNISAGGMLTLTGGSSSGQGNIQMGATASASYDTNLLYLASTANTGGFVFGSTPAAVGSSGPFFIGRGNAYSAIAGQRGNLYVSAGNPSAPASTEGMVSFYTNDTERIRIATGGAVTLISATSASSTFTTNGTMAFGDGGDTATVNSSDWDISATGDMTNIGSITMDGSFSQTGGGTFSTGTAAVSLNGDTTIATGKSLTFTSGAGTYAQTFTGTTTSALSVTANSLTTGAGLNITTSNNTAANTSWSGSIFNITNAQGTTAVSTGQTIAGLDVLFTQNPSTSGNTEYVSRFQVKQNDSASSDLTVAGIVRIANADTSTGNQITATDGLEVVGTNVTNGINLIGTFGTNLILSTSFTVTAGGDVTAGGNFVSGSASTSGTTTIDIGGAGTGNAVCHSGGAAITDNVGIVDCTLAPAADYAEKYPVQSGIAYGEIVAPGTAEVVTVDGDHIVQMVRSTSTYQEPVAGIVSDNYGDFTSAGNNLKDSDNPLPVALVGRVPVLVTNEGGEIHPGDFVTTSSTPGKGMKATRAGRVIGMALGHFTGTSGSVMVQIINTWYTPSSAQASGLQGMPNSGTILASGAVTADSLTVNGDASFNGRVFIKERLYAGADVAGRARIKAGDDEVVVHFAHSYTTVPVVNATRRTQDDGLTHFWVDTESYDGFTLHLDHSAPDDIEFNWFAVGNDSGLVTISDGTTTPIVIDGQRVDTPPPTATDEPVIPDSAEEPVVPPPDVLPEEVVPPIDNGTTPPDPATPLPPTSEQTVTP